MIFLAITWKKQGISKIGFALTMPLKKVFHFRCPICPKPPHKRPTNFQTRPWRHRWPAGGALGAAARSPGVNDAAASWSLFADPSLSQFLLSCPSASQFFSSVSASQPSLQSPNRETVPCLQSGPGGISLLVYKTMDRSTRYPRGILIT